CEDFHFTSMSLGDLLDAQLSWNATKLNPTSLSWYTYIKGEDDLKFDIKTSYFTIRDHRWDIRKNSVIHIKGDSLDVDNFRMARDNQYLSLDGLISNEPNDKLEVVAKDFDLSDIAGVFGDFAVEGIANIKGEIATPFTDLFFTGNGNIDSLFINSEEVGDIALLAAYRQKQKKIDVEGKINYRGIETFDFSGYYDVVAKEDNLNFLLDFKGADLQVANAFMDEDVVSNIAGNLAGKVKVRGEIDAPVLEGKVKLSNGNAKLQLLGANFKFDGEIEVVENGVFLNNIPIKDEEGNTGSVVGQIFHDNFKNFNFDLTFDMEEYLVNNKFVPVDRFLVMNTKYDPDEYYYGKAYIRGTANISGYSDNLIIDVNANTRKGTWIDFPMYGASEIEEAEFIEWLPRVADSLLSNEPKIDFTGVELNLNIGVTPDARLKVIFNDATGDEITAHGGGNIIISLDNYNQLTMEGVFTVDRGNYNFVLGPYKQNFILEKGGTVQWTGSPYDATVNLQTYYKTTANLDVVVQDVMTNNGTRKDEINCYLSLNGELMKPEITFDIKAPKANEMGKATLARIRSDQDELNRQFINLMVFKQFIPLNSGGSIGGGLDLVSTQINSLIDKLNTGANIGVALDRDQLTGDNSVELGVSKEFLDDKLIVSTSFGVENNASSSATNTSNIIGDVRVEYVLNEARTMRVNVYNESNDYSVIQDNNQGQFTQGVGIHYQEDFQNLSDFKLFQYIGNLFRKEEDKKEDNNNKKKIPQEYIDNPALLDEEN
ncbi:translocation/assembly module TamB domain-containing protein, partial [Lishizhenia sp.]|uniref:translocation/assembly module TamB domain-containing protein n=1 Tax=Lishizhenia sp. TaxID=2497594 RepID=UPI00299D05F2